MNLDSDKSEIISITKRHIKINAGPGAGKTKLIQKFVEKRISEGVSGSRILVLSFNANTKNSFLNKNKNTHKLKDVSAHTFHSYGNYLLNLLHLNNYIPKIEIQTFKNNELRNIYFKSLKSTLKEGDNHVISTSLIEKFDTYYNLKRNSEFVFHNIKRTNELTIIENELFRESYFKARKYIDYEKIAPIHETISTTAELLSKQEEFRDFIQAKYDYILVDEGQDLSEADLSLIKAHLGHTKLIIVGDDNQCINQFRGSNPNIFKNIEHIISNMCIKALTSTYRFSQPYNNLVNGFIGSDKIITSESKLRTNAQIKFEINFNSSHPLIKSIREKKSVNETCLILREQNNFSVYELLLLDNNIPYSLMKKKSFIYHKPISMLLGYLIQASKTQFNTLNYGLQGAITSSMLSVPYFQSQKEIRDSLNIGLPEKSYEMITGFKVKDSERSPFGYIPEISKAVRDGFNDNSLVYDVLNFITKYKCMNPLFSTRTAILNRSATSQRQLLNFFKTSQMTIGRLFFLIKKIFISPPKHGIELLTVHEAKGREFQNVFIGGLYDGSFPLIRNEQELTPECLKIEKSLFFVALTRVKNEILLLAPSYNDKASQANKFIPNVSRFLNDLINLS